MAQTLVGGFSIAYWVRGQVVVLNHTCNMRDQWVDLQGIGNGLAANTEEITFATDKERISGTKWQEREASALRRPSVRSL
ncbi:Uncharacterized protein HZ326_19545 [Fusarium oxysporum f. sp. albedinis]|nr:Uncharacterized protein HZ326_19545 [Fusarium oxysporum f. sp. albedinis]